MVTWPCSIVRRTLSAVIEQQVEGCGLASAVRPEKSEDFARPDLQVQSAEPAGPSSAAPVAAIGFAQILGTDREHVGLLLGQALDQLIQLLRFGTADLEPLNQALFVHYDHGG